VRDVLGSFANAKFTPHDDLHVTRHGTIAWTTVTWHLSGKKKTGEAVELDGRQTLIWELRVGQWRIVHEHFSAPLS
jgi:ketosteroid isomerase-like protein